MAERGRESCESRRVGQPSARRRAWRGARRATLARRRAWRRRGGGSESADRRGERVFPRGTAMDTLSPELIALIPRTARDLIALKQCCHFLDAALSDDELWLKLGLSRFPHLASLLGALPPQHDFSYQQLYKSQSLAESSREFCPTTTLQDYLFTLQLNMNGHVHAYTGHIDENQILAPLWTSLDAAPQWFKKALDDPRYTDVQLWRLRVLVTRIRDVRTSLLYDEVCSEYYGPLSRHDPGELVFQQTEILTSSDEARSPNRRGGFFPRAPDVVSENGYVSLDMEPKMDTNNGSVCLCNDAGHRHRARV